MQSSYHRDDILLMMTAQQYVGFRNEVFKSLNDVVDRLCNTICSLTNDMVKSITCRQWIADALLI